MLLVGAKNSFPIHFRYIKEYVVAFFRNSDEVFFFFFHRGQKWPPLDESYIDRESKLDKAVKISEIIKNLGQFISGILGAAI